MSPKRSKEALFAKREPTQTLKTLPKTRLRLPRRVSRLPHVRNTSGSQSDVPGGVDLRQVDRGAVALDGQTLRAAFRPSVTDERGVGTVGAAGRGGGPWKAGGWTELCHVVSIHRLVVV